MRPINYIIIHCSATRISQDFSGEEIDRCHRLRGFSRAGYHYYVRKDGTLEKMRPEDMPDAHCYGHNKDSIGICYEGGLDENGHPHDTRTTAQKRALWEIVRALKLEYPQAEVAGHRDFSPDLNRNGIIEPHERIKECPCFDAKDEYEDVEWIPQLY